MKREFLVERSGRQFVLYAGLLAMAHEAGLKSISTELIQAPTEENGRVAICGAVVTLEKDGIERTFTGIGDAAPNNVTPAMLTCLIRMAETRAKARAIRDAVNVGVAALEETGEEELQPRGSRGKQQGNTEEGSSAHSPRAPRAPRGSISSGGQCIHCHAPEGKPHGWGCPAVKVAA